MKDQARTLMELKEKIENARTQRDRLDGQLESEMVRLEKEYSVKTVKQAEKKLQELQKTIDKGTTELAEALERISDAIINMEG